MREKKWFKAIKRFIELFTPGGTEYSRSGIAIVYSRTGVAHIPESECEKLLFNYLDEANKLRSRVRENRDPGIADRSSTKH